MRGSFTLQGFVRICLCLVLLGSFGKGWGQIAQFNFPATNSLVVSAKNTNVSVSDISLTSGTIETNITTGTYFPNEPYIEESNGWTATNQTDAKAFTFTITAGSGYVFNITNVSFRAYATSAGPTAFGFAVGSTNIYSVNAPDASLVAVNQNVSGQNNLSSATIKIQGWLNGSRTSAGTGVFRLDDVVITGTVTSTSTPTISTGTITGSPFCVTSSAGSSTISVPFSTTGTFSGGNFTAQLSNADGTFPVTPISIGTGTSSPISATIPANTAADTRYRIRVVHTTDGVTGSDNGANLTVNNPITISTQPANIGICSGASGSFTVGIASGTPTYQWQASANGVDGWANVANGTPTGATYTGATTATLNVTSTSGYYYRVLLTNGACVTTSDVAQLTISGTAPTFSTQPSNTTGTTGSTGSFNFTALASGSPTYQWQYSANGSSGWANVADATPANVTYTNATTGTLTVNTNASTSAGILYYRVNATENGCTGTSNTATLTLSAPDFVSISALNTAYTQNFDALTSGSWNNGTTLLGWYASVSSYAAATSSNTSGGLFAVSGTPSTDKALAVLNTNGTGTISYGVRLRNATGSNINYLYLEYIGEQWRDQNSTGDSIQVAYYTASTANNLSASGYTNIVPLNFVAPINSSTNALDGNVAANKRLIGGIIDLSASPLANGNEIMIRFLDLNANNNDHFLAVDDIRIVALNTPNYTLPLATYDNLYIDGASFNSVVDINTTINRRLLINNGTLQVNAGKQLITASTSSWNFNGKSVQFKANSIDGYAILNNTAGGTITGATNVTVERFIPSKSARKNIFLSSPVVGSIANGWQQQIHVTGAGTGGDLCPDGSTKNSNGFDRTQSNSPSIFSYDATTASPATRWVSIPNTTSNTTPGIGYRVVVRGPRSAGCGLLDGTIAAQAEVTLAAVGTLNTGNTSVAVPASTVGNGFFLVGNPYAATIDFSATDFATMRSNNNINGSYWMYDPSNTASTSGTIYSTFNAGSFTGAPTTLTNGNRIASGQAFFMQRTSGTATTVSNFFQSSYIISDQQAGLFRTQNNTPSWTGFVRIRYEQTNNTYIGDAIVRYTAPGNDVSNTQTTNYDAMSLNTGNNVVNTWKGSTRYSIQTRPDDFVAADTVAVEVTASNAGTYQLRFSEFESTANDIFLLDAFTNTVHNVKQQPLYPFTVSADPTSQGSGRFKLVFRTNATLPVHFNSIAAKRTGETTAQVSWTVPNDAAINVYTIERSTDGKRFEAIGTVASKQQQQPETYQFTDPKATQATLYYRVKASATNGAFRYSAVAKLNGKASHVAVQVYPNPVTDVVNVVLPTTVKATSYRVVDATGKVVATQQVQALPGSTLSIAAAALTQGTYYLTIVLANGDTVVANFVK